MKTKPLFTNPIHHWPSLGPLLVIPLALACFTLSPIAQATCQEGCLTNNNTVLGDDALLNNFTGGSNVAIGFNALYSNTIGHLNTATGVDALYSNINGYGNTANGESALYSNTF